MHEHGKKIRDHIGSHFGSHPDGMELGHFEDHGHGHQHLAEHEMRALEGKKHHSQHIP